MATIGGLIDSLIASARDEYEAATDGAAVIDYVAEAFRRRRMSGENAIALQARDGIHGYSAARLTASN